MRKQSRIGRLALAWALALGMGACDGDGAITDPGALAAPAGVRVARTPAGVEVSWSAVAGAESYTVQRERHGSGEGYVELVSEVTATRYTDASALERNAYRYRVLAVRGGVRSAASDARPITVCAPNTLCGTVLAGDTLEVGADDYLMVGTVVVDSGAVLRIAPGATIRGDTLVKPTALLVRQGGKIHAEGTAAAPIVFTSARPVGQRARGDWGGIVIAGRSHCNFPAPCQAEGISTRYGGDDPADDSGVLRYVRIEFAGYEVSPGNELNGLTLAGVGSGTRIDHVQVHYGSDDGIEWFGGTVDVKYALVTGAEDDAFDYSSGWAGKGQFWIVQQAEAGGDKGFEVDGNESVFTATPLTDPVIYNVTLVGRGGTASGNDAVQLRRGVRGTLRNVVVLNWGGAALDVDDDATAAQCEGGHRLVDAVIHFDVGTRFDDDADAHEASCAGDGWRDVDPRLGAPTDSERPDFAPAPDSPVLRGAAPLPAGDDFFTPADFLGAVAPEGTPWYAGWTTTATR